jgi:hypothetical protein
VRATPANCNLRHRRSRRNPAATVLAIFRPLLRPPLPRCLAAMRVHADLASHRILFFRYVSVAVLHIGPRPAGQNHLLLQIVSAGIALRHWSLPSRGRTGIAAAPMTPPALEVVLQGLYESEFGAGRTSRRRVASLRGSISAAAPSRRHFSAPSLAISRSGRPRIARGVDVKTPAGRSNWQPVQVARMVGT